MDLSKATTDELHAELARRRAAERERERQAIAKQFPCPECGAPPKKIRQEAVEEFRFAPRDHEGRPMLYAPPEMGETHGERWETTVVCENGHVIVKDDIRWFDQPRKGPPSLPSGASR